MAKVSAVPGLGRPSRPTGPVRGPHFRMCSGKVRFVTEAEAIAEASVQQAARPHFVWTHYDCLWCDYWHIGRAALADGHDQTCNVSCGHRARQAQEFRRIEGTW